MFKTKSFFISLSLFTLLTIGLYCFMGFYHNKIPFQSVKYFDWAVHYFDDPQATNGSFNFLRSLGEWDAQWYLRVAGGGYPSKDLFEPHYIDPHRMGKQAYAFWPLYPLLISCLNILMHNLELTAFILTIILLYANFFSLYYVIGKLYTRSIANRAIFLLFLFPFSIFYRSYFTEGLFLLLLTWFAYFLLKKRWLLSAICLGFLAITKAYGIIFLLILLASIYSAIEKKELSWRKAITYVLICFIPLQAWFYFNYLQTGDPFYWHVAESTWSFWQNSHSIFTPLRENMKTILSFRSLPFHDFRKSKIDVSTVVITFILLLLSRKFLKPQLWWISFFLWLVPLLTHDLMSYTRYEIVSFPLFIYLGAKIKGVSFFLLCDAFLILLLIGSIFFINWYWLA